MIKIHLLVDEDYIDTFMMTLPQDKVTVIEEKFEENKSLLLKELNLYKENNNRYTPYYESMKNLDNWLKEQK